MVLWIAAARLLWPRDVKPVNDPIEPPIYIAVLQEDFCPGSLELGRYITDTTVFRLVESKNCVRGCGSIYSGQFDCGAWRQPSIGGILTCEPAALRRKRNGWCSCWHDTGHQVGKPCDPEGSWTCSSRCELQVNRLFLDSENCCESAHGQSGNDYQRADRPASF